MTQTLRSVLATQWSDTQVSFLNTDIRGTWRTPRKWESRRPSLPTLLWASCTWRPTCRTRSPSGMGLHSSWVTSTPLEVYWLWVSSCISLYRRKNNKGWRQLTRLRLISRFSSWCFSEHMLWDKPHQTSRCLPLLEELPIKSIVLLTRYDYLHKIQIHSHIRLSQLWNVPDALMNLASLLFLTQPYLSIVQLWVQTKHTVDQMQNLNSQFASLLAYDNAIC